MKDPGLLIVVSGPSGAGKGTICDALRKRFPNINYSISMTTRSPRPGEQDGINYFFSDNAHFEELLAQDAFLEHAKVYDHYYGTPKDYVFRMLNEGKHVMLEIDIQGAMQVKQKYPQGYSFISCRPAWTYWPGASGTGRPIRKRSLPGAFPRPVMSCSG